MLSQYNKFVNFPPRPMPISTQTHAYFHPEHDQILYWSIAGEIHVHLLCQYIQYIDAYACPVHTKLCLKLR